MAWWDHEDLKSSGSKSDRYITTFPEGYSPHEVKKAAERLNNEGRLEGTETEPSRLQQGENAMIRLPRDPVAKDVWTEVDPREILVGFDKILEQLSGGPTKKLPTYPPFNIVELEQDKHIIEIATAGFSADDLEVSLDQNLLKISGVKDRAVKTSHPASQTTFLHKGIASRDFDLTYKLAEFVEVVQTKYENGMLSIYLEKIVPDSKKPKIIPIGYNELATPPEPGMVWTGTRWSKPTLLNE